MKRTSFAIACVLLSSCTRPFERGELRKTADVDPGVEDVPVFGCPARVILKDGTIVEGELLAFDGERIYVERRAGEERRWKSVRRGWVKGVELDVDTFFLGAIAAWTVAGMLSAASHGHKFGIFTAPLFGLVGVGAGTSSEQWVVVSPRDFDVLHQFARYPQGMPRRKPAARA